MYLHIVLHEPEIPPNTGNIVRTCAALGARLHLIEPLGFKIDEATVRRAGLDYWDKVEIATYRNLDDFFARGPSPEEVWYASTKGVMAPSQVQFEETTWIMFGKESQGLPESLLTPRIKRCLRLPMRPDIRSLNLSNTVAVFAYEAMRQYDFPSLEYHGKLCPKESL